LAAQRQLWQKEALGYAGGGLADGIDELLSFALHRKWSRSGSKLLPLLECVLAGGSWSVVRRAGAAHNGEAASSPPDCPLCGCAAVDEYHLYWSCPALADSTEEPFSCSQHLVSKAAAGSIESPCLWYRGLLPLDFCKISTPFQQEAWLRVFGPDKPPTAAWPSGRYYTDGSGGLFTAVPRLRRVGVGIAVVTASLTEPRLRFGAWGPVPGPLQTVPLAELWAVLHVARNLSLTAAAEIFSDSKVTVEQFGKGPQAACFAAARPLWKEFWALQRARSLAGGSLTLTWVKAHATAELLQQGLASVEHVFGNAAADGAAGFAASHLQVLDSDVASYFYCLKLVYLVQQRLVSAIFLHTEASKASMATKRGDRHQERLQKLAAKPLPVAAARIASSHQLVSIGARFCCVQCQGWQPQRACEARAWLLQACEPRPELRRIINEASLSAPRRLQASSLHVGGKALHGSHALRCYRGLIFCAICGKYASARAIHLADECRVTRGGTMSLGRLRKGLLPSGLARWPSEKAPALFEL